LNILILGEFPKHDEAVANFIGFLRGKRKRKFEDKWDEYKKTYEKLNSMGPPWFAATAAIIPTLDSPTTPQDLDRYETERTQYVLKLLEDLLIIAKIKNWL